ncbi:hypothetical protein ILUMI_13778 [Ignelater luminosus]|uniref:Uncharacterized protein n=1 Tax=Ignelater luminosus TaxID=2038154 RepID=A0A8K0G5H0_IGNLU|nr:hypothetical protein ILUMI_13778 [Ignelater luminosus]
MFNKIVLPVCVQKVNFAMMVIVNKYKNFFKNLYSWTFGIAVCHFVLFLLCFLLLCFSFTLIEIPQESVDNKTIFVAEFEKYLILTSAILLLIPFLLSLILTSALLYEHPTLLDAWIKISVGFSIIFGIGLLSSGIYLAVETSYIGYITIAISLLFIVFMTHSILMVYTLYTDYKGDSKPNVRNEDESTG